MIGDYFINVPTDFWIAQKNWKPSTDISAAWAVVEKIKENPYLYPQIIWSHSWVCKIWRNNPNDNEDFGWLAEVYAPTAPEAICRAGLAAVSE
jgi:hypothetical protein